MDGAEPKTRCTPLRSQFQCLQTGRGCRSGGPVGKRTTHGQSSSLRTRDRRGRRLCGSCFPLALWIVLGSTSQPKPLVRSSCSLYTCTCILVSHFVLCSYSKIVVLQWRLLVGHDTCTCTCGVALFWGSNCRRTIYYVQQETPVLRYVLSHDRPHSLFYLAGMYRCTSRSQPIQDCINSQSNLTPFVLPLIRSATPLRGN